MADRARPRDRVREQVHPQQGDQVRERPGEAGPQLEVLEVLEEQHGDQRRPDLDLHGAPRLVVDDQVVGASRALILPVEGVAVKAILVQPAVWRLLLCDEQPDGREALRLEDPGVEGRIG
jgi:hypothetical protein